LIARRHYRVAISHYELETANLTASAKSQAPKPSPAGTLKVSAPVAFAELVVASSFRLGLAGITLAHQVGDAPDVDLGDHARWTGSDYKMGKTREARAACGPSRLRMALTDEIARAAVFLASENAGFVTGKREFVSGVRCGGNPRKAPRHFLQRLTYCRLAALAGTAQRLRRDHQPWAS